MPIPLANARVEGSRGEHPLQRHPPHDLGVRERLVGRHRQLTRAVDSAHSTETARWPIFAAAVAERTNVTALFALPLHRGAAKLGVLDLYRVAPGELSELQRRDTLAAADTAALMMLTLHTEPCMSVTRWLDHGLLTHAGIHQATGMVLAQLDISATEALARMRAHAFAEHRMLIEVANDVLSRQLRFTNTML
jgi:hypothetical protein